MVILENAEAQFVKSDHRRGAEVLLPGRSAKSIEFKWCNISAVLDESNLLWIKGFKPLSHYQERLRELTGLWLLEHPYLRSILDQRSDER